MSLCAAHGRDTLSGAAPRRPAVRRPLRLQNLSCLLRKSGDSVALRPARLRPVQAKLPPPSYLLPQNRGDGRFKSPHGFARAGQAPAPVLFAAAKSGDRSPKEALCEAQRRPLAAVQGAKLRLAAGI
ncbi:hypothetical protein [Paenibacillus sp. FSL H7-0756]|uniref:hypothetical protein n=1 Tax=Paenibacillus sp. FSL H7-0756 TaxID=2954738 RepID=UPI0030F8BFFE